MNNIAKKDELSLISIDFAVKIIELVKRLKDNKEYIMSQQIGRSGTSIGANIREARYAQSALDFISKMEIALKETSETLYWLELLAKTNYIEEEEYASLYAMCNSMRIKLVASCRTAKSNLN